MLAILQFIFSSFGIFCGTVILILAIGFSTALIILAGEA